MTDIHRGQSPFTLTPLWALALALLAGCAGKPPASGPVSPYDIHVDSAPARVDIDLMQVPDAVPRVEPRSPYGNPPFYEVDGQRYFVMDSAYGHVERGIASWYGTKFHGRRTSSGEPYDMFAMTAAHRNLPLPSYAKVTNLENGNAVVVRINDRGPFAHNRVIDLSYAAATRLGIVGTGTGLVEVRVLDPRDPEAPVMPEDPAGPPPRLFVQVGAFSSRDNAERVAERLRAAAIYNVDLTPVATPTAELWRVRAGPLADVAEVDAVAQKISDAGFPEARVVID